MDGVYEEKQSRLKAEGVGKSHRLLKKTLQLVVSMALLSIFVCHSTYYYSWFPHSFNVYLSTFLFSFFTHTLERKYMFLLCNGILAFLAKTSLSHSSLPAGPDFGCQISTPIPMEASASFTDEQGVVRSSKSDHGDHYDVPALVTEAEVVDEYFGMEKEEEESEVSVIVEDEEQQLGGDQSGSNLVISQQQEEDGIATEEVSSTDELNRKVEEFIRKMKEEIRIEAQQQLITAL
ncbi:hypothetical protein COLO4_31921 [Corchorus olitorius]|uniref:DUF4408 domain-containing protein n=1 Tax=Corchorus olitorius TaxID=93759 RepID=A0A1R3H2X2_9ROSI|nr:hypothetical protein COLO4_31921 [Corchorus olitorius]